MLQKLEDHINNSFIPYADIPRSEINSNTVTSKALETLKLPPPPIPWWIRAKLPGWGNALP